MAFDFGSDILVDAMRGAGSQNHVIAKLNALHGASGTTSNGLKNFSVLSDGGFADRLAQSGKDSSVSEKDKAVFQKFEAAILTTFVQSMLPKDAESLFGKGLSGNMWKSQMANQIADQLSKAGGVGIAAQLIGDYQNTNISKNDATSVPAFQTLPSDVQDFLNLNERKSLIMENHTKDQSLNGLLNFPRETSVTDDV
ncbi:MAG: rod-binding protein [Pseudomonadota bacterium]